jgi:hypothetical protein
MSDQKYRQRGYQDSERPAERKSGPAPPRPERDGPRGRGLGAPSETSYSCPQCAHTQPIAVDIGPESVCPKCGAELHCCVNCRFFDTSTRWECRQTLPARIANKRSRNACTLFDARTLQTHARDAGPSGGSGGSVRRDPKDPRAAWDALFKI